MECRWTRALAISGGVCYGALRNMIHMALCLAYFPDSAARA